MHKNVFKSCGNPVVSSQDKLVTNTPTSTHPLGFELVVCTNHPFQTQVIRRLSTALCSSKFSLLTSLRNSFSTVSTALITETTNLINI